MCALRLFTRDAVSLPRCFFKPSAPSIFVTCFRILHNCTLESPLVDAGADVLCERTAPG